jgi:hypothetical protein
VCHAKDVLTLAGSGADGHVLLNLLCLLSLGSLQD